MTKENKNVKNFPNLRFPGFEGEWESKRLGEIATFSKGKGISKNEIVDNGETECIRYGELYTFYEEVISEIKSKTNTDISSLVLSETNDVIIPASGETQIDIATASCVIKSGIALGGDLNIIKTKNNGIFLSYYLNSKKKLEIAKLSQGISVVHLYSSQLASLNLKFPQLEEQEKLSSFLSLLNFRIQTQKKIIEKLESLINGWREKLFSKKSRFKDEKGNHFSDWKFSKLGEVLTIQGGFAFKSILFNKGTTKVLRIGDISRNINLEEFTGVFTLEIPDKKYMVNKGDFLMALSGATFGKVGKISCNGEAYINQRVATFRTNQCLEFFYQLVQTENFVSYINSIPTASAQPNISNNDIAKYESMIPCLEEQNKIANFLSSIQEKIDTEKQILEKLELQKKFLLANLFV
ncbi:type I restriction enzyme S subunit [Chryseobacterium flavum]|uniref:restriction endonuclease subunit S n=1 Tax=Chryseobacterium flavum TaxID=415851 RepID=UPI003391CBEE